MSKTDKVPGIAHILGEHGGFSCAEPDASHARCPMCGACYTCAGVARAVGRGLGVSEAAPSSEAADVRLERLVREQLADAGVSAAYGFTGVISVTPESTSVYKIMIDLGRASWDTIKVVLLPSDDELRMAIREQIDKHVRK